MEFSNFLEHAIILNKYFAKEIYLAKRYVPEQHLPNRFAVYHIVDM